MKGKCVDGTIVFYGSKRNEMLGYEMQESTVTEWVMAGPCEHGTAYLGGKKTRNFYSIYN